MPKRNQLHDVFKHYDLTGGLNDGKIHPERCWPWKDSLNGKGTPIFSYMGKSYAAYRVVYHITHPDTFDLDDSRLVRHIKCDNHLCGNYNHMEAGSHQQNMNDAVAHTRFGLTKDELCDIMDFLQRVESGELDLTHARIAERVSYKHGRHIGRTTVTDINTGRRKDRRKEQKDE